MKLMLRREIDRLKPTPETTLGQQAPRFLWGVCDAPSDQFCSAALGSGGIDDAGDTGLCAGRTSGRDEAGARREPDLPAYDYWSEGLHGFARNGIATVFPQAIGLAASWDTALLDQVGTVVSTEARAKYNAVRSTRDRRRFAGLHIWSPNLNIFRDPRWGRGQETYGEDPYLTGKLGVAFVRGIQGPDAAHPRAIATPKHFAAHSGPEAGRNSFDADISPRDMAGTYTPAFRMAVTEGRARSIMCAYNSLHGVPACASSALLTDRARGDWTDVTITGTRTVLPK